ncbi:hypothetical protein TOPH_07027 [Tolypocladium ophioglossoides CBS 100239]|uniref:Heterokaryon incompatibility domain-containing protein n=1 Tax=Tolypocladium ophioglossoides (strain CBS 100239) TaxID=1163406 RepID=A0A0L0N2S8_TOLOC|nr:hypothetical protein TOPH_07027 [Tolypocladium ophioglossoides CBS 100239]
MAQVSPLCDYCRTVPLDFDELERDFDANRVYHLGSWSRIHHSNCPLCCLVKQAFHQDYAANPNRATPRERLTDVTLAWGRAGTIGGQPAFHLNNFTDQCLCFTVAECDTGGGSELVVDPYFLRQSVDAEVDTARISYWISVCTRTHGANCAVSSNITFGSAYPGLHVLRLIDVEQNCLVQVRDLRPYVALSYIWGAVNGFRLSKLNLPRLLLPGAITDAWAWLPKTIVDAITLVRKLGLRYLWVDALCLLQNDWEDLERGVHVMDQVYERAWLTIIAACGSDSNARLPGVQPGSRKASRLAVEIKPGVHLGLCTALDSLLKSTIYQSRGWTFQEHVLCRRALYFVEDKLFFRCRGADFLECCHNSLRSQEPSLSIASLLPYAIHLKDPLQDYAIMLLYYTERALTNQSDVLRAMAGITRRVSEKAKCRFLQGMPTGAWDVFMVFVANPWLLHRRRGFPSYSWAGWRGRISLDTAIPRKLNEWLERRTWIVWYKRNPSGVTNLVWDLSANENFPAHDESYVGYRRRHNFQPRVPLSFSTVRTAPTEHLSMPGTMPPYPLLQFWTLSAFYKLADVNVLLGSCTLRDRHGTKCGIMMLDGFEESPLFDSAGPFEVILLSESDESFQVTRSFDPWQCYNVMLLEWNQGVAERRGMGRLMQTAVNASFSPGPAWKEIMLG